MSLDHYIEQEDFKTNRPKLNTVQRLLKDLSREKMLFAAGILFVVLGTSAGLSEPQLFGQAIDRAVVPKDTDLLVIYAVVYLGIVASRVFCVSVQGFLFEKLAQRMMQRLRVQLFQTMHLFPTRTFDRTPVGRLVTRLTNDTGAMNEMFSAGFITLVGNFLFILGTMTWILIVDWKLALVALSPFPVLIGCSVLFSKMLVKHYRNARMRMSSLNAFLAENILGMKVVQLFTQEKEHLRKFAETNQDHFETQVSSIRVYSYFQPLMTWCSGLGVALVLFYGGKRVDTGDISPGVLVSFSSYLLALFQPIREFVDRWTIFLSGMSSAERIYAVLDWETERSVSLDKTTGQIPVPGAKKTGEIQFEDVSFSYTGEALALKNFNVTIRAGEKIGVVGHTGAGKSTIIALLLRFYEPQKGRILLDGVDIRTIPVRKLRAFFGLIQQDVFLFSGTIGENVTFWERDAESQKNVVLSERSKKILEDFEFSPSLNLMLEERGSNLSMGEKQVLSFVRAVESNPNVWLLDEPTSSIDSTTEERILERLWKEAAGKTFIMIAHRLATVRSLDRILVLHKGELVEAGSHDELLKKDGLYARFARFDREMGLAL